MAKPRFSPKSWEAFQSLVEGTRRTATKGAEIATATAAGTTAGLSEMLDKAGFLGRGAKWLGKKALWGYGTPIAAGFLLKQLVDQIREARKYVGEARKQYVPSAELMLQEMEQERVLSQALGGFQANAPEAYDSMKWGLSGQARPDLTQSEVMFGKVPSNAGVPPELMQAVMAEMLK